MNTTYCKNCSGVLEERKTKRTPSQLKKPYYYTAYYFCPTCNKLYHDNKFKVTNELDPEGLKVSKVKNESKTGTLFDTVDSSLYDVQVWTDGACVRNGTPGAKAAWAFVSGETERSGLVIGKQTNNRAEGYAIFYALQWAAKSGFKKIRVHTDSQISLFNVAKAAYKVKINREIFEDIEKLISEFKLDVTYKKVLGHSGDPNNERADALANTLAAKS